MGDYELMGVWIESLKARNYSAGTLKTYRAAVGSFVFWCHDHEASVLSVSHHDVRAWLATRKLGPQATYAYTSRLCSFYTWLIREDHATLNPTLRVERPKVPRGLPRPAHDDTVTSAMLDAEPRVIAMIALGAFAGMRRAEIAGQRVDGLLLRQEPPMVRIHGKGQKTRLVPLHPSVVFALHRYGIPESGFLFPGRFGGSLSPGRVGQLMTDALKEAVPHQLRHLAATKWWQGSHDLGLVRDLMGHESIATTQIYTRFDNEDAARVVQGVTMGREAS